MCHRGEFRDENKVQEPIRKTDFAMFRSTKRFPRDNFILVCTRKKTPVQAIGLYLKKNGLIVLL